MLLVHIVNKNVKTDWKNVILQFSHLLEEPSESIELDLDIGFTLCPKLDDIFAAFHFFNVADTKVVILGQDPYFTEDTATGLSFSTKPLCKIPPSLCNINKELLRTGFKVSKNGDLSRWARQGVLLLNSSLTTRLGVSLCHQKQWKSFTDAIIQYISDNLHGVVFMLWGNNAKAKARFVDDKRHYKLVSGHPSPFSVKLFSGCDHFRKCNELLISMCKKEIEW